MGDVAPAAARDQDFGSEGFCAASRRTILRALEASAAKIAEASPAAPARRWLRCPRVPAINAQMEALWSGCGVTSIRAVALFFRRSHVVLKYGIRPHAIPLLAYDSTRLVAGRAGGKAAL